jgi:hypothetical protein
VHRFTATLCGSVALAGTPINITIETAMNETSAFLTALTGAERGAYNPPRRLVGM